MYIIYIYTQRKVGERFLFFVLVFWLFLFAHIDGFAALHIHSQQFLRAREPPNHDLILFYFYLHFIFFFSSNMKCLTFIYVKIN